MARKFKVDSFPKESVIESKKLAVKGSTTKEIHDYLNKEGEKTGQTISMAAIDHWRNDLKETMDYMECSSIQARAILEDNIINHTDMEEAAIKIALSKIIGFLLKIDNLEDQDPSKMFMALAKLQESSVKRDRFKADLREANESKPEQMTLEFKGISDDMAINIRQKIQGVMAPF